MKYCAVLLLIHLSVQAAILHVPSEYSTIQSGVSASSAGDTVFVDAGTYAESISAPGHLMYLLGNVLPDSDGVQRPVIDPSSLTNPTGQRCMYIGSTCSGVIDGFVFRNGPQMFPRNPQGTIGGIINSSSNITFRNCVFDSVYKGVRSDARLTLENCEFVNGVYACVVMPQASLIARECSFDGASSGWGLIEAGRHSLMERCRITDRGVGQTVYWHHADSSVIRDCIFYDLPGMTAAPVLLSGDSCRLERCVFENCVIHSPLADVRNVCGVSSEVRDCEFKDNFVNEDWVWSTESCLIVSNTSDGTGCVENHISNCVFRDGTRERGSSAIYISDPTAVLRNRFVRLFGRDYGACTFSNGPSLLRDNLFYDCELAATTDVRFPISAEYNWWGDSTGPYHSQNNPNGHGIRIGDSIHFDPWYTDTLLNVESVEPRVPLPETASLVAFPNPFNAVTTLKLTLPRAGIARVELFDITGRMLQELWSGAVGESREIPFDGTNFASGMYFVRAWDPLGNRKWGATKIVILK